MTNQHLQGDRRFRVALAVAGLTAVIATTAMVPTGVGAQTGPTVPTVPTVPGGTATEPSDLPSPHPFSDSGAAQPEATESQSEGRQTQPHAPQDTSKAESSRSSSFAASPTAGRTGTDIAVSGGQCFLPASTTPGDGVVVTLERRGSVAADTTLTVDGDGTWRGTLTVPAGTAAAPHDLKAKCVSPGFDALDPVLYDKLRFTVTGEGAGAPERIRTPQFNGGIEPFDDYDGQSTCSPSEKPGMAAFRRLVQANYGGGSLGVSRACGIGGTSEHKEGRAWDWAMNANSAGDRARVQDLMSWMFATDNDCNTFANARRLGMMYIIWNRQIFRMYDTDRGWAPYSGPSPHTDHVHFSLTRDGGAGRVSYYNRSYTAPPFRAANRVVRGIDTNPAFPQPLAGDFDGDGRDDLFWYRPGPDDDRVWHSAGNGQFSNSIVRIGRTYRPFVGDFNGDCVDDVFLYAPGPAKDHLWLGRRDRTFRGLEIKVNGTYTPVVGDFNFDRVDDIVWYKPGGGTDPIWYGTIFARFVGRSLTIDGNYRPIAGDFNGDGPDDIFWFGPGTATDVMWRGARDNRFVASSVRSDHVSEQPLVGDFNGDQRADIFWYHPGERSDPFWLGTRNGGFLGQTVGMDHTYGSPAVGDFNGSGRDDILFHGDGEVSNRVWYF